MPDLRMAGERSETSQPGRKKGVTRRGLMGGAVAGSAAIVLRGTARAATDVVDISVDIAILGAGFSGLAAARQVKASGKSFVLLEARDRVGGKAFNQSIGPDEITEGGATYIGPTQNRMAQLARQYGVATYPTFHQGAGVFIIGGQRYEGVLPDALTAEIQALEARLNALATGISVVDPTTAVQARELDSITLYTWLQQNNASPGAMEIFSSYADLWGAETRDLSLLFVLYYIAAAGDRNTPGTLDRLLDIQNGAQELRFVGGSQLLAQRIAASLGDSLILSAAVWQIDWSGERVIVTADGHTVSARQVIIAFAPALAARLRFEPKLPTARAQLLQRYPMGSLIKVEAVYDHPFWRAENLSGQAVLSPGPVRSTFDNSPPSGEPGVLIGFVGGTRARRWSSLTADDRKAAVLENFAAALGQQALNPIEYFEFDWPGEEWSRGGPVGYLGPGVFHDYAAIWRVPVGPIHWAGTETATFWNGYMEGAVQSGERAAIEALNRF